MTTDFLLACRPRRADAGRLLAPGLLAALCLSATNGTSVRAQQAVPGWSQFHDTRYPFTFSYPPGWDVQVSAQHILISSPQKTAFALVENFKTRGQETAEDHVDALPRTDGWLLRQATVKQAETLPKNPNAQGGQSGEQAVGMLAFQGVSGASEARVLCMISPAGGILFGMGAPEGRLSEATPTLTHVLQSLRFTAPPPTAASATEGGGTGSASSAPIGLDSTSLPPFVHWADPKENVFSLEVPKGWKAEGGYFPKDVMNFANAILVRSPHDEMAVLLGDPAVPSIFTLPSPTWQRLGKNEGDTIQNGGPAMPEILLMHFMPAPEFNHYYLQNYLSKSIDNLQIGEDTDLPDAVAKAEAITGQASNQQGQFTATACKTRFTGRSKLSGRRLEGVVTTLSTEMVVAQGGGNWSALPNVYVWATGDSKAAAREQTARAVRDHMQKTWKPNQSWFTAHNKRVNQFLASMRMATNAMIAQNTARMHANAVANRQTSDDWHARMMGNFNQQMAAKDDLSRKRVNYISDKTDVTNGFQSWKVGSGYSHYYSNGNTVVGTNSPSGMGPDFTPLTQY